MRAKDIKRLAIMGGTFDPVHYGHLVAAEGARHEFQLDRVIFIPSGRPPHKTSEQITDPVHRLAMVKNAVQSNAHFETSALETESDGVSYTIDTVRKVQELQPSADIYFITGADAVLQILTWKNVEEILSTCTFIAATRPGYALESLEHRLSSLSREYINNIYTMEVPALAISSTDIRNRVFNGKPIKYLLPERVEKFISNSKLYCRED
ncbi:MAG: nicotinate-nucleotide adenylyltransferase [Clostridiales bacterium]|nr:nicotinate-nucleotide adenylyltransferase [Clostridiales bacterium]MCF8022988.1 nicotinate-nucleotide adenylyltransferase [Clostridiales bacterium]